VPQSMWCHNVEGLAIFIPTVGPLNPCLHNPLVDNLAYPRLSPVHMDWHTSNHNGKKVYVCVVLDDSSRCILAGGEFDAETTENALQLLKEAML